MGVVTIIGSTAEALRHIAQTTTELVLDGCALGICNCPKHRLTDPNTMAVILLESTTANPGPPNRAARRREASRARRGIR